MTADLTPGQLQTLAARSKRTKEKHDRWARELSAAGWTMLRATGHVTIAADSSSNDAAVYARCVLCNAFLGEWTDRDPTVPLPAVLAAVNGHTCEAGG